MGELGHEPDTGPDLTGTMRRHRRPCRNTGIACQGLVRRTAALTRQERLVETMGNGPLSVVGTIVPVPGLDQFDSASFATLETYRVRQFECTVAGIPRQAALRPNDFDRLRSLRSRSVWKTGGGPGPIHSPRVKGARAFPLSSDRPRNVARSLRPRPSIGGPRQSRQTTRPPDTGASSAEARQTAFLCPAQRGGGGWRMTKPHGAVAAAPVAPATDGSAARRSA